MATIKDAQYIKTISDWASRGRDGKIIKNQDLPSILDGILKHIEVARKKNLISITEEFFCLCALRRSISSPSKHYDDIKSRLDEVTNLIKNNRSALRKG